MGPGICADVWRPDAAGGLCPPPGLCAYRPPDEGPAKADGPMAGLCPYRPPDQGPAKKDADPMAGLCPVPGLC